MPDLHATLLLVTHVAIRQGPQGKQIDDQTAAGIAQWARHFDHVTYYGVEEDTAANASSTTWVDIEGDPAFARCRLLALPRAYRPGEMLRRHSAVRDELRLAIAEHRHLCFTIGGLVGDWPAIAALEAIRQKRRYCAWIDRVEAFILHNKLPSMALPRRLAAQAILPVVEAYNRHLLHHSAVALLQGQDTFDHYARWAPKPHCTYDTHTQISDQIKPQDLAAKQARALAGAPLQILYVGRADPMKGPADWLDTLEALQAQGVAFRAKWVGDGPELPKMKQRVATSTLGDAVDLPGFMGDRGTLLRMMRDSDVFLFCHKTLESPRSLIEALVSGCLLTGYGTAYSRGLAKTRGGAALSPMNDVRALASQLVGLHRDRHKLAQLIGAAAASGELYNETDVYAHRASLMKLA